MRQSAIVILIAGVATTLGAAGSGTQGHAAPGRRGSTSSTAGCSTSRARASSATTSRTAEVGETRMPVPCFLVAHPKGTLMWDVGVIPDDDVETGWRRRRALRRQHHGGRAWCARTLRSQLAAIGYRPADITYVAVSHAHKDHTANLNQFAASTWLTPPAEREFMWKPEQRASRAALLSRAREEQVDPGGQGRARRVRRRHGDHQGGAGPHAGASGAGAGPRVGGRR